MVATRRTSRRVAAVVLALAGAGTGSVALTGSPAAADGRVEVSTSAELIAAFEDATTDVIVFAGDITLAATPDRPAAADDLEVDGAGFALVAAPGSWGLGTSNATGDLTVRDLDLRGATDSGIKWINGSVTIVDSFIRENATPGAGGGVFANGAPNVTITGSMISDNTAEAVGGAVWTNGTLLADDAAFSGNTAGSGGAISTDSATTTTRVVRSSFLDNEATDGDGGAIAAGFGAIVEDSIFGLNVASGDGGAVIAPQSVLVDDTAMYTNTATRGGAVAAGAVASSVNSTFSQNTAEVGAALAGDDVELVYTTIVGNTATEGAGVASLDGGRLRAFASVLADPVGGPSCSGFAGTDSQGFDIEGGGDTCGFTADGDVVDVADVGLRPTDSTIDSAWRPPARASLLVDAVPADRCQEGLGGGVEHDQIGTPRPQGGGCEVGAIELRIPPAPTTTTTTSTSTTVPAGQLPGATPIPGSAAYTG